MQNVAVCCLEIFFPTACPGPQRSEELFQKYEVLNKDLRSILRLHLNKNSYLFRISFTDLKGCWRCIMDINLTREFLKLSYQVYYGKLPKAYYMIT